MEYANYSLDNITESKIVKFNNINDELNRSGRAQILAIQNLLS